jgi:hypothetical protein
MIGDESLVWSRLKIAISEELQIRRFARGRASAHGTQPLVRAEALMLALNVVGFKEGLLSILKLFNSNGATRFILG